MLDRRESILNLLVRRGRQSVEDLSGKFGVTGMTIRRDLQAMEAEGLLTRVHGGCVLRGAQVRELPFDEKEQRRRIEKDAIARAVVARLSDGESLYLDTGTTCAAVARLLPGLRKNMRVFTNNLPAALALFGADSVQVVMLGGEMGQQSPDLTGEFANERLRLFRMDTAVVGADALDPQSGEFYSAEAPTAALSRIAQKRAERVFAVIDSSKFGQRALVKAGRLDSRVTLITDEGLGGVHRRCLERQGAKVVVAKMD